MLEERLGNVELRMEESAKPGKKAKDIYDPNGPFKTNLNLFIEMEYLRLLALAQRENITEEQIETLLQTESIPDYELESLKVKLGIKKDKLKSKRKPKEGAETPKAKKVKDMTEAELK
jgi:hypothetical protein